jgi:hypothetical protein
VLDGVRGRAPVSRAAIADLLVRISLLGAAHAIRLRELDLNPVIAAGASLHVVDWLLVMDAARDDACNVSLRASQPY